MLIKNINTKLLTRSYTLLLFAMFSCTVAFAQSVQDPCARILSGIGQDSLTWSATPCANFDGFIIFASPDTFSPLVAIDTITDPAARGYRHPNLGETPRNYYIALLCGGTVVSTSGIVSNQRPVTPNLRSVSIISNKPFLSWYASPSPEVIGYQVYKENPYGSGNFFPYPANNTIINGLNFADISSSSLLVRYSIVAISHCNAGLLGEGNALDGTTGPHSSMSLTLSIDSCTRDISLNWNAYENWKDGVDYYIIKMSINGGPALNLDSVNANAFVYTNANNGEILEFWIEAREKNIINNAVSNKVAVPVNVNRPMDYLYIAAVSIDAVLQKPVITWRWDTDTDFRSASLQRKSDTLAAWEDILPINTIGSETNNIIDLSANTDSLRYLYRIASVDGCGNSIVSTIGANILLQGAAKEGFVNSLVWTPFYLEYAVAREYELHKVINSSDSRLVVLTETDSAYNDQVNLNIADESNSCYYLLAEGAITLPDNPARFSYSRSNTVCLKQQAVLWFPNAFVPGGKNNTFKPLAGFGSTLESYSLQIFDRYGALIFETRDLSTGWNGTKANEILPQGVYAYVSRYTQSDGKVGIQKGTVMLIR